MLHHCGIFQRELIIQKLEADQAQYVHNSKEIENKVTQAWDWNEIIWWRCQAIES